MYRFIGMNPQPRNVDTVVIDTLSPRSAFIIEHHQFEKLPPGDETVISRGIPMGMGNLNMITTRYPKNGNKKN